MELFQNPASGLAVIEECNHAVELGELKTFLLADLVNSEAHDQKQRLIVHRIVKLKN